MHRLPDRASLGVKSSQRVKNFVRGALSARALVEIVLLSSDRGCHCVLVDQHAAEPEVGLRVLSVPGVHADRQVVEPLLISLPDRLLLRDVLVQIGDLASDHSGNDIAHAVVVADLLVLVPGSVLAALRGPLADLLRVFLAVCKEHSARGSGDDLVAVEADRVIIAQCSGLDPLAVQSVFRPQGFGRVLNDQRAVPVADLLDLLHPAGRAVQVRDDDKFNVRVDLEGLLQRLRAHVPGVVLRVDKDRLAVLVSDGIDAGVKSAVRAENLVSLQRALIGLRLSVQFLSRELGGHMQRGCAAGKADRVLHPYILSDLLLNFIYILPNSRDPVRLDRLVHPFLLVAVHRGRRQP